MRSAAAAFSSKNFTCFVPGIGTKSESLDKTHASANCAGVQLLSLAIAARSSTKFRFDTKFDPEKRGIEWRISPSSSLSISRTNPDRKALPSGLKGTNPIPNSLHRCMTLYSGSRVHNEYSDWTAQISCSAWALPMVSDEHSERPM